MQNLYHMQIINKCSVKVALALALPPPWPHKRPPCDECDSRADGSHERLPAAVGGGVPPVGPPQVQDHGGGGVEQRRGLFTQLQVQGKERMCSGPH